MRTVIVAVKNESSVVDDAQVPQVVAALQAQVSEDFASVWGVDATLQLVAGDASLPMDAWWLVILDDSDQAGDLGYHDSNPQGLPMGKVFARSSGSQWTVTASHELLEMLADPDITRTVQVSEDGGCDRLYAFEVCDPVEEVSYKKGNVDVSDFVYPSWFETFSHAAGTVYDFQKKVTAPFQMLEGGSAYVRDLCSSAGWQQVGQDGNPLPSRRRARVGSRRERRRTVRTHWYRSDVASTRGLVKKG